jgi:small subunit ribosomal protein S3
MGQKIHPIGLRLSISESHRSVWFSKPNHYAMVLAKDQKIRHCIQDCIKKYVKTSLKYAGIARIEIQFNVDLVQVQVHTAFPALLLDKHTSFPGTNKITFPQILRQTIQNLIGQQKLKILFSEVTLPYSKAIILCEYVALQLENRVAFRKTMKKAIEFATIQGKVKGIKIQISGRLNGAEIARVEWAREGRVPLHTLRAKIDYCHCPAQTIYGVLGIKIWVFQQ